MALALSVRGGRICSLQGGGNGGVLDGYENGLEGSVKYNGPYFHIYLNVFLASEGVASDSWVDGLNFSFCSLEFDEAPALCTALT